MDLLTRLGVEQDCANLLVDYCAAFDDRRIDDVVALFMPDADWVRAGQPAVQGLASIKAMAAGLPETMMTCHVLSNIRIVPESADVANGRSVFTLYAKPRGEQVAPVVSMIGEYIDRFQRIENGWRFAHRESRYLFVAPRT